MFQLWGGGIIYTYTRDEPHILKKKPALNRGQKIPLQKNHYTINIMETVSLTLNRNNDTNISPFGIIYG